MHYTPEPRECEYRVPFRYVVANRDNEQSLEAGHFASLDSSLSDIEQGRTVRRS